MRRCHDGGQPADQECLNQPRAVFNQLRARSETGYRTSLVLKWDGHLYKAFPQAPGDAVSLNED